MLVYRLEDEEGRGPFSSRKLWPKNYNDKRAIHAQHGCTIIGYYDIPSDERSQGRFGCRNITQLRKYWGEDLKQWVEEGWVISVYKVRKNYVKFSKIDVEVMFNSEKAVRL